MEVMQKMGKEQWIAVGAAIVVVVVFLLASILFVVPSADEVLTGDPVDFSTVIEESVEAEETEEEAEEDIEETEQDNSVEAQ